MTVRRRIKKGEIEAKLVQGRYGEEYRVEVLPEPITVSSVTPAQDYSSLIFRLEQLNQEVGYWRARAELAEGQVKMLESPKSRPWWRRLLNR